MCKTKRTGEAREHGRDEHDETTALTSAEQPIFTYENLQQLWVRPRTSWITKEPEKQTEKPAPILEHDQFVDIMDSFSRWHICEVTRWVC